MDDAIQNKVVLGCSAFTPGPAGSPVSPGVLQPRSCPIPVVPHPGKAPAAPARSGMGKEGGEIMAERGAAETGAGAASVPGVTGCGGLVLAGLCRDPQSMERLNPRVKPCREREGREMMLQGMCVRGCACTPAVGAQGLPGGSRAPWGTAGPGSPLTPRDPPPCQILSSICDSQLFAFFPAFP